MPALYSSNPLDRSPSLSSNSSGASSLGPITPALPGSSTFPSPAMGSEYDSHSPNPSILRSSRGSIANLAAYSRGGKEAPSRSTPTWTAGHRAGSASVDSPRTFGGLGKSPSLRTGLLPIDEPKEDKVAAWRSGSPRTRTLSQVSQYENRAASPTLRSASPTPSSPSHHSYVPSPSSYSPHPSPTAYSPHPSSPTTSARALSSSIFSSRSPALPPPHSPLPTDLAGSVVGSVRSLQGSDGLARTGSFARGHRRAMTLPHLGEGGLPVPPGEAEVVGLPGRARLSRPAESPSPFAPSAVFSSSHGGLNKLAGPSLGSGGGLLPSQTVRAMDRQRQDLVAYEYLCHVAEAKEWLSSCITTRGDNDTPLWGAGIGDFEQGLRNGYALAHLARSLGGPECQSGIYNTPGLTYRHTDNIVIFFHFVASVGLPEIFRFETLDLYDAKNLPKVIYCLHALSHLLARRGMAQRMTNLVGQIDFTDEEVSGMQNDLNKAGVRMPNFGGIGKALAKQINEEPEPEPETEQQRQDRELADARPSIVALQARARGSFARKRFFAKLRHQRAIEEERERAAEETRRARAAFEEQERLARLAVEEERRRAQEAREEERRRQDQERREEQRREEEERCRVEEERARHAAAIREADRTMVGFHACARGALVRRHFFGRIDELDRHKGSVTRFQAIARGALARRRYDNLVGQLGEAVLNVVGVQATIRGVLARRQLLNRIRTLKSGAGFLTGLQAHIRGQQAREAYANRARNLRSVHVVRSVGGLQSLARAALVRRRVDVQRQELGFVEPDVVGIQAHVRGWIARNAFLGWQDHMYGSKPAIISLQSLVRGLFARRNYDAIRRHFHENLSKVVRLQAAIRSRRQGSQYRQLRMGTNVPVSTIKNFVNLLDDSEFDYRGELQVEAMRKELVRAVRETERLEDDVKDLDTKIALFVKNTITHEVARAQRAGGGGLDVGRRNSVLAAANDPFAATSLDRQTQRKLELYQQLFWHLQTTPAYLARLFANTGRIGMSEKRQKQLESTTFVIFGYAQNQREEFLLLKLFQRSIQEELGFLPSVADFVRGNFTFIRLLMQYGRGATQKKYLRDLLAPQVKSILRRVDLDLCCDPLKIYRSEITREETETGVPSSRPQNVDYLGAIRDPTAGPIFVRHLQDLRATTDAFLGAMRVSTAHMPFGVRYVAREVYNGLRRKFPNEDESNVLRAVCHLVYYRFIQPAAIAPETFGIIEGVVPAVQRQNLAEICKLLNQVSVGRLFNEEQRYLMPLNEWITERANDFSEWIRAVIHVPDAEVHFRANEYIDSTSAHQASIWISPNDIYSAHSLLAENLDIIVPDANDPLRAIVAELGGAPSSSTSELNSARTDEVSLTLMARMRTQDDPDAAKKALFNQAKRRVLAILKVHHGADLLDVLTQPVNDEDEDAWLRIVEEEEEQERRQAYEQRRPIIPPIDDIRNLTFAQLKAAALQDVIALKKAGLVSDADKYQAILNAIAFDIRSKHNRRVQRQQELSTMRSTLASLDAKKRNLDETIGEYNKFMEASMKTIQKAPKKRLILPWSLQAIHERKLEKAGKNYKFGSYKYTAQTLYDRGILLSIDQYSPRQFDKISLTISSDEVGTFEISASSMGISMTTVELKLEDLLEMQFVGKQTISIGGVAKANLNLIVHLINRKFYR